MICTLTRTAANTRATKSDEERVVSFSSDNFERSIVRLSYIDIIIRENRLGGRKYPNTSSFSCPG